MHPNEVFLEVFVEGIAAPQGSKKLVHTRDGKPLIVEDNKRTRPWRKRVTQALRDHMVEHPPPVSEKSDSYLTKIRFYLPRPKSVSLKKRKYPNVAPDVDKLERAVNDSIVDAGVIVDDGQIVDTMRSKRYEEDSPTGKVGVLIVVEKLT